MRGYEVLLTKYLSEEILLQLYAVLLSSGRDEHFFFRGMPDAEARFLAAARQDMLVMLVKGKPVGLLDLENISRGKAEAHFVFFGLVAPITEHRVAKYAMTWLLSAEGFNFQVVIGKIDASNYRARQFVEKIGMLLGGLVPHYFFNLKQVKNVNCALYYATKDEFPVLENKQ